MKLKKLILLPTFALMSSGLSSCALLCTVTWKNWDGTILEIDKDIFPGKMASYDNKTPVRPSDAQFDYKFKSWDKEVKRVWRFRTVYTATYSTHLRSYTVKFVDSATGEVLHEEIKNYGEMPSDFTPDTTPDAQYTYEFTGWDQDIVPVSGDTTYTTTIGRTLNEYNVTFLGRYDDIVLKEATKYKYGETPVVPEDLSYKVDDPQLPDYYKVFTFSHWEVDGVEKAVGPVTGTTVYKAKYDEREANFYDMTYYVAGSKVTDADFPELNPQIREGDDLVLPNILSNGHDVKWYLTEDYKKDEVTTIEDVGSNMYFYGKDEGLHDFKVSYDLDGGALPSTVTNPDKVTFDDVIDLNNPEKDGYTFVCWTSSPDIEKDDQGTITNEVTTLTHTLEDVELYAHFEQNVYTVYFDVSTLDLSLNENLEVDEYNSDLDKMIHPTFDSEDHLEKIEEVVPLKIGYSFEYWKEPGKDVKFEGPYKVVGDVTLEPKFKINEYDLTFNVNGGKELTNPPASFNIDNYDDALPQPERTGYDFAGWFVENAKVGGINPTILPGDSIKDVFDGDFFTYGRDGGEAQSLSLVAAWNAHTGLSVSFDLDGGTELYTISYLDGAEPVQESTVADGLPIKEGFVELDDKAGYQFAGWEDDLGNLVLNDFEVDSDTDLHAKWNPISTHYENGTSQPVFNETIKVGEEKVVNLHNYNAVYLDFTTLVSGKIVISSSGDFDLLMTPSPIPEPGDNWQHAISQDGLNFSYEFDAEAGHIYTIRVFGTHNEDGSTTVLVAPKDSQAAIKPSFEITAKANATFDAIEVAFDGELNLIADPVKAGYKFEGWYYNDKLYETGDLMDVDDNITLKAHWSEVKEEEPTEDPGDTPVAP